MSGEPRIRAIRVVPPLETTRRSATLDPSSDQLRQLLASVKELRRVGLQKGNLTTSLERALEDVYVDSLCWIAASPPSLLLTTAPRGHLRWLVGWAERVGQLLGSDPASPARESAADVLDVVVGCTPAPDRSRVHVIHVDDTLLEAPLNRLYMLLAAALQSALWHADTSSVLVTSVAHHEGTRIRMRDGGQFPQWDDEPDCQRERADARWLDLAFMHQVAADLGARVRYWQDELDCVTEVELPRRPVRQVDSECGTTGTDESDTQPTRRGQFR